MPKLLGTTLNTLPVSPTSKLHEALHVLDTIALFFLPFNRREDWPVVAGKNTIIRQDARNFVFLRLPNLNVRRKRNKHLIDNSHQLLILSPNMKSILPI